MHKLHLVKVSFRNKEKSKSENNHFILIRTEKKKEKKARTYNTGYKIFEV